MLRFKILIFAGGVGWGGGWQSTFDAESSIDKIQNSNFYSEGGGGWWLTFDAGSRNAKIQNSEFCKWGGGGGEFDGQLLMLSPEVLKSKIPIFAGEGCLRPTVDAESRNDKIQILQVGGGEWVANF